MVNNRGKKPFRFEAVWVENEGCTEVIKQTWGGRVGDVEGVMKKLQDCGERLRRCNNKKFEHVKGNLQKAQSKLETLQESDPNF